MRPGVWPIFDTVGASQGVASNGPPGLQTTPVPLLELPSRGCAASGAAWESTSRGDAVIELTKFVFETLRQGGEFALRRGLGLLARNELVASAFVLFLRTRVVKE